MGISILLARFLGIFLTIWGIGAIANQKRLPGAIDEIVKSKSMQLIAAFIPLVMGSFFVAVHNRWVADWTISVTIVGWLFLLGGAFRAIMTEKWVSCVSKMKSEINLGVVGAIIVLLGMMFLYFGYR